MGTICIERKYDMTSDRYYFDLCEVIKTRSKDKSTKVGCVIVGEGGNILSTGYNSFPRDINDNVETRHMRPEKYFWFEHAERNAIYNACRIGTPLLNSTIYVPGIPCVDCMRGIIQSGIRNIVISILNTTDSLEYLKRWKDNYIASITMLREHICYNTNNRFAKNTTKNILYLGDSDFGKSYLVSDTLSVTYTNIVTILSVLNNIE